MVCVCVCGWVGWGGGGGGLRGLSHDDRAGVMSEGSREIDEKGKSRDCREETFSSIC